MAMRLERMSYGTCIEISQWEGIWNKLVGGGCAPESTGIDIHSNASSI
jgi:hypothetical protein